MDTGDKAREFMRSLSGAVEFEARAAKQGTFIEVVVLSAALIDAMLRLGIILKHQLDTRTNGLLPELLHQGEADAAIMECAVYRRARDASVIAPRLHDELNRLYDTLR